MKIMLKGAGKILITILIVCGCSSGAFARYLQADPIGPTRSYSDPVLKMAIHEGALPLMKGQNPDSPLMPLRLNQPYSYADGNPISNIDPFGLANGPAVNWQNGDLSYGNYLGTMSPCLQCELSYQLICFPTSFGMKGLGQVVGGAIGAAVGKSGGAADLGARIGGAAFAIGGMGICQLTKEEACSQTCKDCKNGTN